MPSSKAGVGKKLTIASVRYHANDMKPACPQCHQPVEYTVRGGLFSAKCEHCDWETAGTANIPLLPPVAPAPPMVASTKVKPSADALKAVRETFVEARELPLHVLAERLWSSAGIPVGTLPAFRLTEVRPQLQKLGVELRRAPHEEDR